MLNKKIISLLCCICFSAQLVLAQKAPPVSFPKDSAAFLRVEGEVTTPLKIGVTELAAMKHTTAYLKDRDGKEHPYSGVPVSEILNLAGVSMGGKLRGENLAKYLLVQCADGYEVLFSLAELDSSFTDRVVILADQFEGGPIPTGKGPLRLVVPGEKKPARSCHQVVAFVIRFAKD